MTAVMKTSYNYILTLVSGVTSQDKKLKLIILTVGTQY